MLLDSYAWVEFFEGSEKGKKVAEILKKNKCFTSIVSISEIINWTLKNNEDFEDRVKRIESLSKILNLNRDIVITAGKINFQHKKLIKNWGMLDSLIYSTALYYNLNVLTGDNHFKNLENVEMLR